MFLSNDSCTNVNEIPIGIENVVYHWVPKMKALIKVANYDLTLQRIFNRSLFITLVTHDI